MLACLFLCVSPLLHVLGGVWQHWEVTKEVNDDRPSIMLYGLCMALPWRVAALCSNSEQSVPPYNLAGAPSLTSPLLAECLFMWDTGRVWLTHCSLCDSVCVCPCLCKITCWKECLSTQMDCMLQAFATVPLLWAWHLRAFKTCSQFVWMLFMGFWVCLIAQVNVQCLPIFQ